MDCRLLLDVIVSESAVVLQLLASKDETLLVRWDGLLVLDFGLQGVDSLGGLHIECDVLSCESLDEYLHS